MQVHPRVCSNFAATTPKHTNESTCLEFGVRGLGFGVKGFELPVVEEPEALSLREDVNGTISDSYDLFEDLRRQGVRAHSWV